MVLSSNWLQLQKSTASGKDTEKAKRKSRPGKIGKKPFHTEGSERKVKVEAKDGAKAKIKTKTRTKVNIKSKVNVKSNTDINTDINTGTNTKANTKAKARKEKRNIMDMVNSMTREIYKLEREKLDGKMDKPSEACVELSDKLEQDIAKRGQDKGRTGEIGKYVSMDCEFVGVGLDGKDSALARVSIVNFFGHVVLDVFVKPQEKVTDWRTWVSGIKPHHMVGALGFSEAQKQVASILEGRILVGHSVSHDLEALFLSHPKSMIRDTSRHIPFRQTYAKGKTPSLKKLAKEVLGIDIQGAEHSSVEDARATMLLYKSDKKEFEKLHQSKFGSGRGRR